MKEDHCMPRITWDYREYDRELFDLELEDFVPDTVYDVHAHLYLPEHDLGESKVASPDSGSVEWALQ